MLGASRSFQHETALSTMKWSHFEPSGRRRQSLTRQAMQRATTRAMLTNEAAVKLGGRRLRATRWTTMTCDAAGSGLAEVSGSWLRGARAGDEEPELVERGQSCSRGAGAAQEERRLPDRSRSFLGGREELELAEGGWGCPGEGAELPKPSRSGLRGAGAAGEKPELPERGRTCSRGAGAAREEPALSNCKMFCDQLAQRVEMPNDPSLNPSISRQLLSEALCVTPHVSTPAHHPRPCQQPAGPRTSAKMLMASPKGVSLSSSLRAMRCFFDIIQAGWGGGFCAGTCRCRN